MICSLFFKGRVSSTSIFEIEAWAANSWPSRRRPRMVERRSDIRRERAGSAPKARTCCACRSRSRSGKSTESGCPSASARDQPNMASAPALNITIR
jgi:hypothetical protein